MWVAIDCRSKNWVAVLKRLGSTGLVVLVFVILLSRFRRGNVNVKVKEYKGSK
jgi:hypothetical protein